MAITFVIQKSPLNPVEFVTEDFARNPLHHTIHPGTDWEVNTLPRGVQKVEYPYKCEIADPLEFQFNITYQGGITLSLQLVKRTWTRTGPGFKVLHTWATPTPVVLLNNAVEVDGVVWPQHCFHYRVSPAELLRITPGVYHFRLTAGYNKGAITDPPGAPNAFVHELSGPIRVAPKFPGTILLKARNNTNDLDGGTIFVQTGATFASRMEGALHKPALDSVDTAYTNMRGARKKLYSKPGDSRTLTIGGITGVSDWMLSFANHALSCDYKEVDGVAITKNDDANWEDVHIPGYPLGGMSMSVRYADPAQRYKSIHRPYVALFTRPGDEYFIHSVGTLNAAFGSGIYINGIASERQLLLTLNQGVKYSGFKGYVTRVGNEFRYYNGPNESEDTNATFILPHALRMAVTGAVGSVFLTLRGTIGGIVWDADNVVPLGDGSTDDFYTEIQAYPIAGQHEALLFHNNSLTELSIVGDPVTAITGKMPVGATEYITSGTSQTVFDVALLAPARTTLETVGFNNNDITTLLNTTAFALPGYPVLSEVSAKNNNIPVAQVNQLIEDIDDMVHATGITGGILETNGQTPAATPTGTGATAKAHLISVHSWSVNTD